MVHQQIDNITMLHCIMASPSLSLPPPHSVSCPEPHNRGCSCCTKVYNEPTMQGERKNLTDGWL